MSVGRSIGGLAAMVFAVVYLLFVWFACGPAAAQTLILERKIPIRIDARPLDVALELFARQTQLSFFRSGSLNSHAAYPVRGSMTPRVALILLTSQSGLAPRFLSQNSFMLEPLPFYDSDPAQLSEQDKAAYYRLLQKDIEAALCTPGFAGADPIDAVVQLWLDRFGRPVSARIPVTKGDVSQVAATLGRLVSFRLSPPPAGLGQPIVLTLHADATRTCVQRRRARL